MVTGLTHSPLIRRRLSGWMVLVFCLLAGFAGQARAQTKEYQIKAAFLFNFSQFVEWPPTVFTDAATPFRIGILGENSFGTALEKTVEGETVSKHKIVVQRARRIEELEGCQLIFIAKSEQSKVAEILARIKPGPTLTVSECDGFAQKGGIINFYPEGTKVRFEINPEAVQRAGLKLSSQLLSLGKIVKSKGSP